MIRRKGLTATFLLVLPLAALRNAFNFSERACQTSNPVRKEVDVQTTPPVTVDYSATVSQWEIFDSYTKDLSDKAKRLERERARKGKKKKDGKPEGKKKEAKRTSRSRLDIHSQPHSSSNHRQPCGAAVWASSANHARDNPTGVLAAARATCA